MAGPLTAKRLAGLLAAAMALSAMVACSPAAPATTPTKAPAASTPAGSTAPAATKPPAASAPASAPTAAPKALTKVAVGSVDFFINRHSLPYYVGMGKGFFAAEGLQVEMVNMASAGDALRAVDAGTIVYLATGVGGA